MISVFVNALDMESPTSDVTSTENIEDSRKFCFFLSFLGEILQLNYVFVEENFLTIRKIFRQAKI